MRKVRMIPGIERRVEHMLEKDLKKKKVAAYARVSTDTDEQLNSYEAQISYYTSFIKQNKGWDFVGIYTDEGVSGLIAKKRDGFQRMLKDAIDGKIDLIITKSVSRFARNTVDTLTTVRTLKEHGVEVFFEKENIYTMDSKGELLITIMSSLAQEESRSLSENTTWGKRKSFSDGKVTLPYSAFLGYKRGADGIPKLVPEEAKIVRRIYKDFLLGMTYTEIALGLTADKIPTPAGKRNWSVSTVRSILTNEKYKGDALLQKKFTTDFLTKKMKKNEGEVPQYYVNDSHEGIVSEEIFEMTQLEVARRGSKNKKVTSQFFSGRLICGDCGQILYRKVWHSTDKYKRYIWQCGDKYEGETFCMTPHMTDDQIKTAFIKIVNALLLEKTEVLELCSRVVGDVLSTKALEGKLTKLEKEAEAMYDELGAQIHKTGKTAEGQAIEGLDEEFKAYEELQAKCIKMKERIAEQRRRKYECENFIRTLGELDRPLIDYDEKLWVTLVEVVVVERGRLVFRLRSGVEKEVGV